MVQYQERHEIQKYKEVFVISFPNTVTYPGTMMIKFLYASPTIITMDRSRWSVNLAYFTHLTYFYFLTGWAKLQFHQVGLVNYDPVVVLQKVKLYLKLTLFEE